MKAEWVLIVGFPPTTSSNFVPSKCRYDEEMRSNDGIFSGYISNVLLHETPILAWQLHNTIARV